MYTDVRLSYRIAALGELRPSFQLMTNFVLFMARQFAMVEAYPLLDHKLLVNLEDMMSFRQVFSKLLIKTAQDFTLRSCPQLEVVGIEGFDAVEAEEIEAVLRQVGNLKPEVVKEIGANMAENGQQIAIKVLLNVLETARQACQGDDQAITLLSFQEALLIAPDYD